jgi:hypothetical protein
MSPCTLSHTALSTAARRSRRAALFPALRRSPLTVPVPEASSRLSPRNRHSLRAVLAAMSPCAAYRLL